MRLEDFIKIAEYGNVNWKGGYTPKEVAYNAYDYLCELEYSKRDDKMTRTILELLILLNEDGSEECIDWAEQITREINGCE